MRYIQVKFLLAQEMCLMDGSNYYYRIHKGTSLQFAAGLLKD